ncbi:ABC transporter substrate-binding protein [Allosalinactinospora lopnorensis]|uniref:ABC transporter substrate-binding protein n=1 Tax=Allosalinactinospora lopnorensis TaxID=1352348 RepID=UPI00191C1370|nr:ABC transporter substrate-binding protein [Allosalinactinospora lopnorensis]
MSRFDPRAHSPRHSLTRRSLLGGSAFALAAASTPLLSSCASGTRAPAGGDAITFLSYLPMESLTFAPEMLADAAGHFEEQGLTVDFETTRGSPQAIQLLMSGSALLTRLGQIELMISAGERDAEMINIGSVIRGSSVRFISAAGEPLNSPEDFVGKTMGIPSEGGTSETVLDLVLMNGGVDPEEVDRQVVGLSPGTFELVQEGRVAGYVVGLDTAIILEEQQDDVVVFDPGTMISSDAQVYVTTPEALESDQDLLQRYITAVHGAMAEIAADDELDETLEKLRSAYSFTSLDDDAVAKESLRRYVSSWTADNERPLLHTDDQDWIDGYEELTSTGFVDPGLSPEDWIDNGLVPQS